MAEEISPVWPSVTAVLLMPVVVGLLIGLGHDDGHRGPSALALAAASVPALLASQRAQVTAPRWRMLIEGATMVAMASWVALALWAVLDSHR